MKKVLLFVVCCLCLCGCGSKNKELLIGDWWYRGEIELFSIPNSSLLTFNQDNTFEMWKCLDDDCAKGECKWKGTYSIKDNIISLSVTEENLITRPYGLEDSRIIPPPDKMIVDFDNMYMCDREEGLDCEDKYEK